MNEARQRRLAENEVVFRALNENILGVASALGGDAPYEFICECAMSGCFERLSLTLAQYEQVRADGAHFLLAPDHEVLELEQVVAVHDEYVVVEKDGVAGVVAHADDPRG